MTEIFLTKMILNPRSPQVRRDLGNPQELHRTVSGAFLAIPNPEGLKGHDRECPRGTYNLLHRVDLDSRGEMAVLFVQSSMRPNWSTLGSGYAEDVKCRSVHDQYDAIRNAMRLRFRLRANASKRDKSKLDPDKPKQRKRYPILREADQIDWLRRQGARAGFEIADVRIASRDAGDASVHNTAVSPEPRLAFRKRDSITDVIHKVQYGSVLFDGILVVTDADRFRDALTEGIGPGKAYGFGLLSVAPAA